MIKQLTLLGLFFAVHSLYSSRPRSLTYPEEQEDPRIMMLDHLITKSTALLEKRSNSTEISLKRIQEHKKINLQMLTLVQQLYAEKLVQVESVQVVKEILHFMKPADAAEKKMFKEKALQ